MSRKAGAIQGSPMHKSRNIAIALMFISSFALSEGKKTYLSCPGLDSRANDLKVIIDQNNGTASLQSSVSGDGLNFTSLASFGPGKVEWVKKSHGLFQKFSVDRSTLKLVRETTSSLTGSTYLESSSCSIIEYPRDAKF